MGLGERIKEFAKFKGLKAKEFERIVGLSNGSFAKLCDATRKSTINRISKAFPDLNPSWLLTGEGEMIKPSVQQTSYGSHSPNLNGNDNSVFDPASLDRAFDAVDKLLEEVAAHRRLVEQSLAQNATLISILQTRLAKA